MPFEIPQNLHPDCAPIAWLLGTWRGNGHGDYPTIDSFSFAQEITFLQDGRPFFHYLSRSWVVDAEGNRLRNGAIETGFFRSKADGSLEVVLAHATGIVEIWYGRAESAKVEIATDAVARVEDAAAYGAGHRLYGLVEGELLWTFDMAAVDQGLQPHLWARLVRQDT
ncbi:MAG: DUF1794 [uncultured Nocardioidaceae bacterium]|uniref:Peroxynitrite isomerase n=1 Tax=uncultured Nocardioidaceae bacterium TaxID=253824 RepID=A0A6J4LPY3_9ACTN|nr:MAG: DUF1794 [uncultured Nocardioidaceae bacterium]